MKNANLVENCIKPFIIVFFCIAFLCSASPIYAYYFIRYDVAPIYYEDQYGVQDNVSEIYPHLSLDSDRFSFFDSYDWRSETTWRVESAQEDENGRIDPEFVFNSDPWYGVRPELRFTLEILSSDGNLNPEAVRVDAWGGMSVTHEVYRDPYRYTTACCSGGQIDLDTPMWDFSSTPSISHIPGHPAAYSDSDSIDGSFTLYTNTIYDFRYWVSEYVESWVDGFGAQWYFDTWEEYNEFMAETGGSGGSYTSARGFANFNLALSSDVPQASVPEPSTTILLGLGLLGLAGLFRKNFK